MNVLTLAALALAAAVADAAPSPALLATAPWWEKITVTVAGDGKPQSCNYETSLRAASGSGCDVVAEGRAAKSSGPGAKDQFTRITFERRFIPGWGRPDVGNLQLGDKLLGRHVMALSIDAKGAVQVCKVVATAGDMTPNYGCDEAQAERFEASASHASAPARQGFLTVLVYGHEEHVA